MVLESTQRFRVDIDLAEPDGPRNAHFGRCLLSSVLGHDGAWSAQLALVQEDPRGDHQPRLLALEA